MSMESITNAALEINKKYSAKRMGVDYENFFLRVLK